MRLVNDNTESHSSTHRIYQSRIQWALVRKVQIEYLKSWLNLKWVSEIIQNTISDPPEEVWLEKCKFVVNVQIWKAEKCTDIERQRASLLFTDNTTRLGR